MTAALVLLLYKGTDLVYVLLKSPIVGVQIIQFRSKEIGNHRDIMLIIDNVTMAYLVL